MNVEQPYLALRDYLDEVLVVMKDRLEETGLLDKIGGDVSLFGGKMLRARLMFRVGTAADVEYQRLVSLAAAVETAHAASLLHDDVIDEGCLRRGAPTFWIEKGVSAAILLGDVLVCLSMRQVLASGDGTLSCSFVDLLKEMCCGELEQDLTPKSDNHTWEDCLRIAGTKTGSLFSFAAMAADPVDGESRQALSRAGYALGTAYQLVDDLLDAAGDEGYSLKTLGTDATGNRISAVSVYETSGVNPTAEISGLLDKSLSELEAWPALHSAWSTYLREDFKPVTERIVAGFAAEAVR